MSAKKILVVCLLTAIVAAGAVAAWGVQTGLGHGTESFFNCPVKKLIVGHLGRLLILKSKLDVTQEQKDKVSSIVKSHLNEIVPVAKTVLESRKALREAVLKQPTDEKAIRSAARELAKAAGDASVLASRVIAEARPVLSPKQQQLILSFRAEADKATFDWLNQLGK